jgi:hypothetical protein
MLPQDGIVKTIMATTSGLLATVMVPPAWLTRIRLTLIFTNSLSSGFRARLTPIHSTGVTIRGSGLMLRLFELFSIKF